MKHQSKIFFIGVVWCLFMLGVLLLGFNKGRVTDEDLVKQEKAQENVGGYIFLAEYDPLVGGRSSRVRSIYLHESGLVQESYETQRGTILRLKEGRVISTQFFTELEAKLKELPRVFKEREGQGEYYPAHLYIFLKGRDKPYMWAGERESVPKELQYIIETVQKLVNTMEERLEAVERVYIRATLLHEKTVKDYKQSGLFLEFAEKDVEKNPYLAEALAYSFRLIHIKDAKNPFASFRAQFKPGRDVIEFSYNNEYYQIRSLKLEK